MWSSFWGQLYCLVPLVVLVGCVVAVVLLIQCQGRVKALRVRRRVMRWLGLTGRVWAEVGVRVVE